MITDWLLAPLLAAAQWVADTLPDGDSLTLPDIEPFWKVVAGLNSLLPVADVLYAALALLGAVVVFVTVRLVLTIWNLVYP